MLSNFADLLKMIQKVEIYALIWIRHLQRLQFYLFQLFKILDNVWLLQKALFFLILVCFIFIHAPKYFTCNRYVGFLNIQNLVASSVNGAPIRNTFYALCIPHLNEYYSLCYSSQLVEIRLPLPFKDVHLYHKIPYCYPKRTLEIAPSRKYLFSLYKRQ